VPDVDRFMSDGLLSRNSDHRYRFSLFNF
jgi:hypothetical protein